MRYAILIAYCCTFIGCSVASLGKNVVRQTPYDVKDKTSMTISVTKFVDAVDTKKVIGKSYYGVGCLPYHDLRWAGRERFVTDVSNKLRSKLEQYNYPILGKAYSSFNEEYSKQSDFVLGGRISDIQSNACYSIRGVKGEVYVKIEWEVYDTKKKLIVLTIPTEGFVSVNRFVKPSDSVLYDQAIEMAIDNLLSDKVFYGLLTQK